MHRLFALRSKSVYSIVLIAFVIVGLILCFSGWSMYNSFFQATNDAFDPQYGGFGIIGNDTDVQVNNIQLVVEKAVPMELYRSDVTYADLTNNTYNLIFWLPFHISSALYYSDNMTYENTPTGSALILSFHGNGTMRSFTSRYFSADLYITNTFVTSNRGAYTMVLPFSGIKDAESYTRLAETYDVFYTMSVPSVDLYVSLPKGCALTNSFPQVSNGPNHWVNPVTNRTSSTLKWTLSGLQDDVTIYYESSAEEGSYQNDLFYGGILLGTGIPIVLGSLYDGIKWWAEKKSELSGVSVVEVGKRNNGELKKKRYLRPAITLSDFIFMLIPSILGTIAFIISFYSLSHIFANIVSVQTVDSDAINGLLAISGIIFAIQAFFVKKPEKAIRKLFLSTIFIVEVLTFSLVGFNYVADISNSIFPSVGTFFLVFFSLTFTLLTTSFFIIYDTICYGTKKQGAREDD